MEKLVFLLDALSGISPNDFQRFFGGHTFETLKDFEGEYFFKSYFGEEIRLDRNGLLDIFRECPKCGTSFFDEEGDWNTQEDCCGDCANEK